MSTAIKRVNGSGNNNWNYTAVPGSNLTNKDAKIIGPEIIRLEEKHGKLTPEILVQESKSTRSKTHRYFEWDDKTAAHKHRLDRARYLMRSVQIEIITNPKAKKPKKANIRLVHASIPTSQHNPRGYKTLDKIIKDGNTNALVQQALQELTGWQRRYITYAKLDKSVKGFSNINQAINALRKELKNKRK